MRRMAGWSQSDTSATTVSSKPSTLPMERGSHSRSSTARSRALRSSSFTPSIPNRATDVRCHCRLPYTPPYILPNTAPSRNTTLITTHQPLTSSALLMRLLHRKLMLRTRNVSHCTKVLLLLRMTADKGGSHNKAYAPLPTQPNEYTHLLISGDLELRTNTNLCTILAQHGKLEVKLRIKPLA